MEKWDIYDIDRIKTGKTIERGAAFPEGAYHIVVHICLFNEDGDMLIQQRQPFKEGWSNMWDVTVGGSATSGDTSQQAAARELFEELGYEFDFSNIRPHLTINFGEGFDDFYLIESEVDLEKLQLQAEEVQRVKWASKEEILEMQERGEFIPYYKSLIELVFAMRQRFGAHSRE